MLVFDVVRVALPQRPSGVAETRRCGPAFLGQRWDSSLVCVALGAQRMTGGLYRCLGFVDFSHPPDPLEKKRSPVLKRELNARKAGNYDSTAFFPHPPAFGKNEKTYPSPGRV